MPIIDPRNPGGPDLAPGNTAPAKEVTAHTIAMVIVWTFSGSVGSLILLVFLVVLFFPGPEPVSQGQGPEAVFRSVVLLTKAAAPALKEFGTFISTVFGTLLAFVLGYYFGEQKKSA